jgi:hypothetical protein
VEEDMAEADHQAEEKVVVEVLLEATATLAMLSRKPEAQLLHLETMSLTMDRKELQIK